MTDTNQEVVDRLKGARTFGESDQIDRELKRLRTENEDLRAQLHRTHGELEETRKESQSWEQSYSEVLRDKVEIEVRSSVHAEQADTTIKGLNLTIGTLSSEMYRIKEQWEILTAELQKESTE